MKLKRRSLVSHFLKGSGLLALGSQLSGLASFLPKRFRNEASAQTNLTQNWARQNSTYRLFVWGSGVQGVLGLGSVTSFSSPVQLTGSWIFADGTTRNPGGVANSGTSYGIRANGTLWAWGRNGTGELGQGNTTSTSSPVQIAGSWSHISGGDDYAVGVRSNKTMWAWGSGLLGALGYGSTTSVSSPVQITGTNWISVKSGDSHSAALRDDLRLFVWGYNGEGGLGQGNTTNTSSPVQVAGSWLQVDCGYNHTVGIRTNNTLWVWGGGVRGALGNGGTANVSSPVQIAGSWLQIAAAPETTAGIRTDNTLWMWGANFNGALGQNNTTNYSSPVQVAGTWKSIAVGSFFGGGPARERACAAGIRTDDTLWTWGYNVLGQLGLGDTTDRSSPVQVPGRWIRVNIGGNWMLAVKDRD